MARKKTAVKKARSSQPQSRSVVPSQQSRTYTILDYRLEKPYFHAPPGSRAATRRATKSRAAISPARSAHSRFEVSVEAAGD